jgi:hypothetical protein
MEATAQSNPSQKMSNLQLELLKLYARGVSDEELSAIRDMLANFFANKLMDEVDAVWEKKGYSNETMNMWVKTKRNNLRK